MVLHKTTAKNVGRLKKKTEYFTGISFSAGATYALDKTLVFILSNEVWVPSCGEYLTATNLKSCAQAVSEIDDLCGLGLNGAAEVLCVCPACV